MAIYAQIGMDEALRIHEQADEKKWNEFLDKFKPKKTTDDCYTPENVFEVIAGSARLGRKPARARDHAEPGTERG